MQTGVPQIQELIKGAYERRTTYIKANKLQAYRLAVLDEVILGAAIDIYANNAVIHIFDAAGVDEHAEMEHALRAELNIEGVFYKDRTKGGQLKLPSSTDKSSKEALKNASAIVNCVAPSKKIIVEEFGAKFECNMGEYLDVGLFLDHRETRKKIMNDADGKILLNTFAYTGSFSVHASLHGATKTYSVDLSKTYCEWIKRNMELNNLPLEKNWVYKMDTLEFFRYAQRKNLIFDIIVIDPPTFSRNKKETFHVQKDHVELLAEAGKILSPAGYIMFSNNYTGFVLEEEKLPQFAIEEITMIPTDFEGSLPHLSWEIRHK